MSREHANTTDAARASGPPAALQVLRARTSASHATLDSGLAGDDHRVTDEATYLRLLRFLATLHATTEPALHAWVAATPWVREALADSPLPRRAGLYADDLERLGATTPVTTPAVEYDDARGLAALYLLAGSAKGARVLLRGLPDDLAPGARSGLTDAADRPSARLWGAVVGLLGEPLERALPDAHLALAAAAADEAVEVFARLHGLGAERVAVMAR